MVYDASRLAALGCRLPANESVRLRNGVFEAIVNDLRHLARGLRGVSKSPRRPSLIAERCNRVRDPRISGWL